MAVIAPFKGIVYNPEKIKDMADVCTPPYDVISKEEQEYFYRRHPYNIVRLDFGKTTENDGEDQNVFTRAAEYFRQWLNDEVLVEDPRPAFYLTAVEFDANGEKVIRYGMIVRVGLEPFEKGIILPHERTFSKVKSERLNLIKVCHANFSPIFSLYSDPENTVLNRLREQAGRQPAPDMSFVDSKGLGQRMWRITDEALLKSLTETMADKIIYIADGHHRYETALNYRKWASETLPDFNGNHPANFVMMYLSCMDEPGLTIFPAHRLLHGLDEKTLSDLISNAEPYFDITRFIWTSEDKTDVRRKFQENLLSNHSDQTIGVAVQNRSELYLFKTKPGVMKNLFSHEIAPCLIELDVTVLTHLIFMKLMGFDMHRLDNEQLISYSSDWEEALDEVELNRCEAAFILNPTRIEQVKDVAEAGLIMPRKSTYFYPKVITGQVMNKLF